MARTWPLSDKKPIGLLWDSGHARAVMHADIANPRGQGKRSRYSRRKRPIEHLSYSLCYVSHMFTFWYIDIASNLLNAIVSKQSYVSHDETPMREIDVQNTNHWNTSSQKNLLDINHLPFAIICWTYFLNRGWCAVRYLVLFCWPLK